jgi:thioredoxin reductase (NADPH)
MTPLDVCIVGAGPCGLACGIEAQKAGLSYLILEKGNITESIRNYPINMIFFSTSEMIEVGDIPFTSLEIRPSRIEALKYYRKVVRHFKLQLSLFTNVENISIKDGHFEIKTSKTTFISKNVILATGYYDIPKKINVEGEGLPHVSHYYKEPYKYSLTNVVVVGGANSAIETALDLYRNGANVQLVHQFDGLDKSAKYWIVPDLENRIKKNEVSAYFKSRITRITSDKVYLVNLNSGIESVLSADFVFLMTGYRPDETFLRKIGIELNGESLIPSLNESTYESNIPGVYIAGSMVGGEETAKIFIENGRLHGKSIIADILSKKSNGF